MTTTHVPPPLKVLYHTHLDFDTLDLIGPFEILSHASYPSTSPPAKAFINTLTAVSDFTTTAQELIFKRHIPISEAYAQLAEFDILVIPGGVSPGVLEGKTEPLDLINLLLAEAGLLDGKTATTHPGYYDKLKEITKRKGTTSVVEDRFVVNKTDPENGLRIVTARGVSSGIDAGLWLVGE